MEINFEALLNSKKYKIRSDVSMLSSLILSDKMNDLTHLHSDWNVDDDGVVSLLKGNGLMVQDGTRFGEMTHKYQLSLENSFVAFIYLGSLPVAEKTTLMARGCKEIVLSDYTEYDHIFNVYSGMPHADYMITCNHRDTLAANFNSNAEKNFLSSGGVLFVQSSDGLSVNLFNVEVLGGVTKYLQSGSV